MGGEKKGREEGERGGERGGGGKGGECRGGRGIGITFGSVARFVLPEPGEVLVFEPGNVGIVVFVILLARPFGHIGGDFLS